MMTCVPGTAVVGVLTFAILWFFSHLGHRWPKWVLLFLIVTGVVADVQSLDAQLSNPDKDIAPITVTLIRLGPGHYTSNGLTIPFAGDWKLEIKALVTDVDEVAASTTVPVRS